MNCNCEVKLQIRNVVYNLNRHLWVTSALATEKLQICFQKTYHINVKTPFQLVFVPNVCEAYSRNICIPTTVELTNNDSTLILHK